MVIGQLLCTGGYPSPLPEGGGNTPPPGNITLVLTNQCSQVTLSEGGTGRQEPHFRRFATGPI